MKFLSPNDQIKNSPTSVFFLKGNLICEYVYARTLYHIILQTDVFKLPNVILRPYDENQRHAMFLLQQLKLRSQERLSDSFHF